MRVAVLAAVVCGAGAMTAAQGEPTLDQVLARMGDYVAAYGQKAAVVVATEKYSQSIQLTETDTPPLRPRQLEAEFAIVRVSGGGWTGFRDVVSVDGKPVPDRRDRLMTLLTDTSGDVNEVMRIANESARFNVGPVSRNFNVPTATMFFFRPKDHGRYGFEHKGTKTIDGVRTWEIAFKETRRPTLIMTRAGKDVPMEGTLWVDPQDGTIVRTRLRLKNFADTVTSPEQTAPQQRAAPNPNTPTGAREAPAKTITLTRIDTVADIEVTYKRPPGMDLWLPASMTELYEGPVTIRVRPVIGRSTTRATYSDFKQFNTSIKIAGQ